MLYQPWTASKSQHGLRNWDSVSNMSHSLNSLKGVIQEIIWGTTIGVIKGDTRSVDYR